MWIIKIIWECRWVGLGLELPVVIAIPWYHIHVKFLSFHHSSHHHLLHLHLIKLIHSLSGMVQFATIIRHSHLSWCNKQTLFHFYYFLLHYCFAFRSIFIKKPNCDCNLYYFLPSISRMNEVFCVSDTFATIYSSCEVIQCLWVFVFRIHSI